MNYPFDKIAGLIFYRWIRTLSSGTKEILQSAIVPHSALSRADTSVS